VRASERCAFWAAIVVFLRRKTAARPRSFAMCNKTSPSSNLPRFAKTIATISTIILGCPNQDADYIFLLGILDLIHKCRLASLFRNSNFGCFLFVGFGCAKISHLFASLGPLLVLLRATCNKTWLCPIIFFYIVLKNPPHGKIYRKAQ
jgi:hypothetical protein